MSMAGVGVIWVTAPSLDKLAAELDRRLAGYSADSVLSMSAFRCDHGKSNDWWNMGRRQDAARG